MLRRLIYTAVLAGSAAGIHVLGWSYDIPYARQLVLTFASLAVLYGFFKLVVEEVFVQRIEQSKTRYVFRKANSVLYIAAFLVGVGRIWIADPQTLVVAYGIVGAGVAVSLQDFFKNFVGGLTLLVSGTYQIGDRIEVDGTQGDVIDVGIMYTQVMEIGGWVSGDQATGRIVSIPNGAVLGRQVTNYTKDNSFVWDEITIPVTYESDIDRARDIVQNVMEEETAEMAEHASEEISEIRRKYFMSRRETRTRLYTELTDNWVNVHARYITDARKRRETHNAVSERILDAFEAADDVEVASQTIAITRFPGSDDT